VVHPPAGTDRALTICRVHHDVSSRGSARSDVWVCTRGQLLVVQASEFNTPIETETSSMEIARRAARWPQSAARSTRVGVVSRSSWVAVQEAIGWLERHLVRPPGDSSTCLVGRAGGARARAVGTGHRIVRGEGILRTMHLRGVVEGCRAPTAIGVPQGQLPEWASRFAQHPGGTDC